MSVFPELDAFQQVYVKNLPQVVWTRLVADLETPVSAMLKLSSGNPNCFLLESVEGGAVRGRYSIIGLKPDIIWRVEDGDAFINRTADADASGPFVPCGKPLTSLRSLLAGSKIELPEDLPPMAAGVFGYMGYDMVREVEDLGPPGDDHLGLPDAIMIRPTVMAIFDAVKDEVTIVTPVWPAVGIDAEEGFSQARGRLEQVVRALDEPVPHTAGEPGAKPPRAPASNTKPEAYCRKVEQIKDYIAAGDAFQVVISQRFTQPFDLAPFSLYRSLRRINPSPFLYFLDFGTFAVAGSSPEILVRVRDNKVTIRPLAGTRPRGDSPAEDKRLGEELLSDPKERAEHLMLLDLGRNDVGRVAEIGTVEVTDQFVLEHYSQVMHIVSNVEGRLSKDHDAIDALFAGFPAGTVSGAPKVRAMEIIDELEDDKRGIYAGCVGYFSANGDMDSCIVLRTAIVKDGVMHVQAGAGIVADSDPQSEHDECINKAKALFRAAEDAARFAGNGGI
jgi:anthranilate synthase component 1